MLWRPLRKYQNFNNLEAKTYTKRLSSHAKIKFRIVTLISRNFLQIQIKNCFSSPHIRHGNYNFTIKPTWTSQSPVKWKIQISMMSICSCENMISCAIEKQIHMTAFSSHRYLKIMIFFFLYCSKCISSLLFGA